MTLANVFETYVGHHWGHTRETRTCMRLRYALVEALLKAKTPGPVDAGSPNIMGVRRKGRLNGILG